MLNNRIEKKAEFAAPRNKVWNAIADSKEFGLWFGMKLQGPFIAGQMIRGQITPTTVDAEVARLQKPHEGKPVELFIDRIEPETRFCMKWRPFAIDPNIDYSNEPMTLITFRLEDGLGGQTLLTLTEEGFEGIPESRRAEAMRANDGGWSHQMVLLGKYLGAPMR